MASTSPQSGWSLGDFVDTRRTPGAPHAEEHEAPGAYNARLQDPFTRYYRAPIARLLARPLAATPITPAQIMGVQPILAALAGYLVTFPDAHKPALAAGLFALRALTGTLADTLATQKNAATQAFRARRTVADGLGMAFLYIGILWHFRLNPPPTRTWSALVPASAIILFALAQGALRFFAAAHYRRKYIGVFEQGHDEQAAQLAQRLRTSDAPASFEQRIDAALARLALALEGAPTAAPEQLAREARAPLARFIGRVWAISNGETFFALVLISLATNYLWQAQLFFATVGVAWILAVIALNRWFVRQARVASA